jgi:hypothetical protein
MLSTVWNRFVRTGALLSLAAFALASVADAKPAPRPGRRTLNLFATSGLLLEANRIQCGLDNVGQVCVAFSGSPVGGGGFWPKGTPDQYIFNSGLQLAGIVDPAAGFSWAGDTAGAFFFDPRGDQGAGDGLTQIFNSLDQGDINNWPTGAIVRDPAVYDEALLGQKKISDGDSWVRYWEGNPTQLGGREHPMGIMVEQRSMSWNFPVGNEDILYFVFTFYNVTASNAAAYADLDPAIQGEVAAVGQQFQDLNETKFGILIPNDGYTITNLFAAFAMDADVAVFRENYATAVLPFNLGTVYSGTFLPEVGWRFPSTIFGPPFFPGAGFVGVKYLKSPESSPGVEVGLTMFGNTTNSSAFPDAVGDHLLYRRLSGFLSPSDVPCTFTNPAIARARRLCYLAQAQDDARFYQSSGPFDLGPGESQTIVVAYIHAAPVATPGVVPGADTKPGIPFTGDSIFADGSKVRTIDRVMGWVSQADANNDSIIQQNEVVTTPRSLLNKALVAQAVFDAKFLLPNAPTAPQFFLVPSDNSANIVWQRSQTELEEPCVGTPPVSGVCGGDVFFNIASRPFNVDTTITVDTTVVPPDTTVRIDSTRNELYDPNFRQFDVEGYRVYRGRTKSELTLLVQFDYSGTKFIDYTGALAYGDLNRDGKVQCAPELGFNATPPAGDCPIAFDTSYIKTTGFPTELSGNIVQVKAGERVLLANGDVLNLIADTAVTGGATVFPGLTNTGITFAYTDNNVRNGFTYHYAVTAFDLNSVKSGPSSLESGTTKTVTPRAPSGQEIAGSLRQEFLTASGAVITNDTMPTLDATTGQFSRKMPPTDGIQVSLASLFPQVLGDGSLIVKIDSMSIGMQELDVLAGSGRDAIYYLTGQGAGAPVQFILPIQPSRGFAGSIVDTSASASFEATRLDSTKSARFGGNQTFSLFGTTSITLPGTFRLTDWGRADANAEPENSARNGPRWWEGPNGSNENTVDPVGGVCTPANGGCAATAKVPDITKTAGQIPGVTIAGIHSYLSTPNSPGRIMEGATATVARAADIHVVWGAGGAIDTVWDDTHGVPVPFDTRAGASWGILDTASFAGTPAASTGDTKNGLLTWSDAFCVAPLPRYTTQCGAIADNVGAVLQNTAALSPIAIRDTLASYAGTAAAGFTATGNGFIFYLTGHFYLMQMAALPAAGTIWHVRSYSGYITGTTGSYAFISETRPPNVPGLTVRVIYSGATLNPATTTAANLNRIHTVPDPYYVSNALETTANQKVLNFVNLPAQAIVRIYSVSGVLVNVLTHNDPQGGGLLTWDLRNRNNQFVASGVYFYHVEAPDGKTKVGRFTVVNFAP